MLNNLSLPVTISRYIVPLPLGEICIECMVDSVYVYSQPIILEITGVP